MGERRKSWKSRVLMVLGYTAFFLFCFVLFAYLTFPYDRIEDLLIARVRQSSPGADLSIESVGPHGLTGLSLSGVTLQRPAEKGAEPPAPLDLTEVTVSAAPLALLTGSQGFDFGAVIDDGELSGTYSSEEEGAMKLNLELDQVELGRLGVEGFVHVPLTGRASGTIELDLTKERAKSSGEVDLKVDAIKIGDGKAKLPLPGGFGGVTVPPIDAGDLQLKVEIKEGVATITQFEADGKDVSLSGSGSVRLAQRAMLSRADLTLGVKVAEAFKKREARIATVLELGQVKAATGADGTIRFALSGPLTSLSGRPMAATGRGAKKSTRVPKKSK